MFYYENRDNEGAAVQGPRPYDGEFYSIRVEPNPTVWFQAQWTSLGWQTAKGELVDKVIGWEPVSI
jgi:hypothetical protein